VCIELFGADPRFAVVCAKHFTMQRYRRPSLIQIVALYGGRSNRFAPHASMASQIPATLVNADVIHDDDVATLEIWSKDLFDISQEAVHRSRFEAHTLCSHQTSLE
jgi:hypothetical protein